MEQTVQIKSYTNSFWNDANPLVSFVTTVYNRTEVLKRAMASVEAQTFRGIEYIIVDNGSKIDIDVPIVSFLNSATIPVKYIKRSVGLGPHTGRNTGIKEARGKFIIWLDSDDEYVPEAVEKFLSVWDAIPKSEQPFYREVCAQCKNEKGERVGLPFPEGINEQPWNVAQKQCYATKGEHSAMMIAETLKQNLFPEPEGVTYVSEIVIWNKLEKLYKSYYINDMLRVYYTNSSDSITVSGTSDTGSKKDPYQIWINTLWTYKYLLQHWNDYDYDLQARLKKIVWYNIYKIRLKQEKKYPDLNWAKLNIEGVFNKFVVMITLPLSAVIAKYKLQNK